MTDPEVRRQMADRLGFALDPFQLQAMDALDEGRSVLVSAPTGSGKTIVAEYAVAVALSGRRRAFYTTPIKALSNQKLGDLSEIFGEQNVGLLTGDTSLRPDAPLVVMTTEVLRNMLFSNRSGLDELAVVVLDEVHFLQDPTRGSVWEEVIILAPKDVKLVCLSATVSNAEQVGAWISSVRGPTEVVVESHRPVELRNHLAVTNRSSRKMDLIPLVRRGGPHPRARDLDEAVSRQHRHPGGSRHSRFATPRRSEIVEELLELQMLPAIYFIFSRAGCDDAVSQCISDGIRLVSQAERQEIVRICEEHTEGLSEDDARALGYGQWITGLQAGIAAHHAGMVPAYREAVEECFNAGLLRVVFATETLAVGINMPARSVVIEKLTKMREHGRSALTSGEYAQLTGRAGRRGLDTLGHGLVVWNPHVSAVEVSNLAVAPPANLQSSFRPTYNLAVNLVQRYPETDSRKILDSSFAQFLERRHGEALSRRFDRILKLLRRWGYVDAHAWKLTGRGALLTRLYHDADLLVAEALVSGMFDHLDAPCTAAMVSLCTFESRSGQWRPEPTLPRQIHRRVERIGGLSERLQHDEEHLQLARTRHPDHGFADAAWRWARGEKLSTLLERVEMTPGDFVRSSKQLIDLLRQISLVAPVPATAVAAADAVSVLHRGVVAAGPPVVGDAPGAATNKIGSATGPSSRS